MTLGIGGYAVPFADRPVAAPEFPFDPIRSAEGLIKLDERLPLASADCGVLRFSERRARTDFLRDAVGEAEIEQYEAERKRTPHPGHSVSSHVGLPTLPKSC